MKKSIFSWIITITLILGCLSGCSIFDSGAKYEKACEALAETKLTETGSYKVTEELRIASQNAEYTEPKNIIYMIGDGMGINIVETTRDFFADSLYEGTLAIDLVPQVGWQSTYSADAQITDSAAGGTALATGYKTSNGTIAMDKLDQNPYKTVLELAAEKGKSTGIIATKAVTDATPASFTAHVADRGMQEEIAAQQLEKLSSGELDLVLGGGRKYYTVDENQKTLESLQNDGLSYVTNWESTSKAELPVLGLYGVDALDIMYADTPTVAEMTEFALEKLSEDENGFFLMVEGSQIDTKAHAYIYVHEAKEMYDFDCAISVALKYVALHPDTVLVITADHETGGLHLVKEATDEVYNNFLYTTDGHTSIQVPVYAIGAGVEALDTIQDNVDVARFVATLLGEMDFGQQSEITSLFDDNKPFKVSFGEEDILWSLPNNITKKLSGVVNARAIHIKVKNVSGEKVHLPSLVIQGEKTIFVAPQSDYLENKSEMVLTYVLPVECWEDGALASIQSMALSYQSSDVSDWKVGLLGSALENATFKISEVWVTDRRLEQ